MPNRQQLVEAGFDTSILPFVPSGSDRFVYSNCFVPFLVAMRKEHPGGGGRGGRNRQNPLAARGNNPQAITVAHGDPLTGLETQLSESFGVLFLDRVRIRPIGSTLGEELLSLSLAPGEEVVIEQQTFSKRETTYEDQNETSQELDLQLESTLTTGLEEGLDQQRNRTNRTDIGLKADVTIPVDGVPINVGGSAQNSVTDADNSSRKLSIKKSQTSSSKVASKYRSMHKTTLRISSEQTFQASNKRTLRNPNRYTPLDLRYFKIYQQVEMHHERYGVRLAWAPCVEDPGARARGLASAAYQEVIDDAKASVDLPSQPEAPAGFANSVVVDTDSKNVGANWFGSGQRTTITLTASPPVSPPGGPPYVWDGKTDSINSSLMISAAGTNGPVNAYVDGLPWTASDGTLNVPVHLGWDGGGQVTVSASATFVPSSNFVSQAMADYQQKLADYNSKVAALLAQAIAGAQKDALAAKDAVLASIDPLAECFRTAIATYIPASGREDCSQFDVWRTLFDWDLANVTLYPGWWGVNGLADPTRPMTDFVNAVSARVYLPIKPMMEQMAIELLAPLVQLWPNTTVEEAAAAQLLQDFSNYRQQTFGDPLETLIDSSGSGCPTVSDPAVCLGSWIELMPTEGTHLEVVQASTAADDDLNEAQLRDAAAMRKAQLQGVQATTTLNQTIDTTVQAGSTPLTVKLVEGLPNQGGGESGSSS